MAADMRLCVCQLLVLVCPVWPSSDGRTLSVRHGDRDVSAGLYGGRVAVFDRDSLGRDGASFGRDRRDARDATQVHYDDEQFATVFPLNDSHHQLMVHWAGEDSDVVVCLAKESVQSRNSTSAVYISDNYGKTFKNMTEAFMIQEGQYAIINQFYNHPKYNDHYVFTDIINKYIFTTTDFGRTFRKHQVDFKPVQISFDAQREMTFLSYDENDPEKRLWLTEDFGGEWQAIQQYVKSFYWDTQRYPSVLYVQREEPTGASSVIRSKTLFVEESDEGEEVISGVEDFELKGEFMLATKKRTDEADSLDLYVSHAGSPFQKAQFPSNLMHRHYYVVDAAEGQLVVCVHHQDVLTNLYVSGASDGKGALRFSLSLERVLYFHPNETWQNTWLHDVTSFSFADFHKVEGLRGVYIASQIKPGTLSGKLGPEDVVSLITFDRGGVWENLKPPAVDEEGRPINCSAENGCSLHLSQKFSYLYPVSRSVPILSSKSAIGLIMGTGVVGTSLKGHPAVFLSDDGGISWHQILRGNYFYSFGDHGGIVVAVKYLKAGGETNKVLYSTDDGATFQEKTFLGADARIHGLMIEPGENTTVFTMFGSYRKDTHQWMIITVNLSSVFKANCTKDDYKLWSPRDLRDGRACLLGKKMVYERRAARSNCYNGKKYERLVSVENCLCSRADFECDFGFKEDEHVKTCVKDPDSIDNPYTIPTTCKPGEFYNRTKGYRRIPGDTCEGGEAYQYQTESMPCPVKEEREFMLVAQRQRIIRINIKSLRLPAVETLPLPNLKNVIALDFDKRNNCIYWADIDDDVIMRQCLNGRTEAEVLVESQLESIEGMSLDWTSNNLYFVDGVKAQIEAIRTDVSTMGRMRRTILSRPQLEKPRGIAVHPTAGFIFYTDWSGTNPCVGRANSDGTDWKRLVEAPKVEWPNGITIDHMAERIYWADAKKDYVASADLNGENMKTVLSDEEFGSHPFAVGIYKSLVFWDDWNKQSISMADKDQGKGVVVVRSHMASLMDLKIYGHGTQEGTSGCTNNTCGEMLCASLPGNKRACLCPDGMSVSKDGAVEKCVCPNGEEVAKDGKGCVTQSSCSAEQFTCNNTRCVPSLWKCDGDNDCGDGSDEAHCSVVTCTSNHFPCTNGRCIPMHWRCDFDDDCGDASDESQCTYSNCSKEQFSCKNGRCISARWKCDFDDDCRDGSDEANCTAISTCRAGEFGCSHGTQCIPTTWRCDGEHDCADGSDEKNCTTNACQEWQFQCQNKVCVFQSWKCDGDKDCIDGSDELNCSTTAKPAVTTTTPSPFPENSCHEWTFRCARSNLCVPLQWKCDGVDDCGDGSDEIGCGNDSPTTGRPTTPAQHPERTDCGDNRFQCYRGECIWESSVCDGVRDCLSGEDEQNCHGIISTCRPDQFRCEMSGLCKPIASVCNGVEDCPDGSDESGCTHGHPTTPPVFHCPNGNFPCDGSRCFPLDKFCDSHADCYDGKDEMNCDSVSRIYQVIDLGVDQKNITQSSFLLEWWIYMPVDTKLEYQPSICEIWTPLPPGGGCAEWKNESWTDKEEYLFTGLKPYTRYNMTVYVRLHTSKEVYPPSKYYVASTSEGIPSAPTVVNITQANDRQVELHWAAPATVRGVLMAYLVYVTPPTPPLEISVSANQTTVVLEQDYLPMVDYTFWVRARNRDYLGDPSPTRILKFDPDVVVAEVTGLNVTETTSDSVTLGWGKVARAEWYIVQYKAEDIHLNFQPINTSESRATLRNLSPGESYKIQVVAVRKGYQSPPVWINARTPGDALPKITNLKGDIVKLLGTSVKLHWDPPKDKRKVLWNYGIYYGVKDRDLLEKGVRNTTSNMSFTVRDLEACENYDFDVGVVGPLGYGPITREPVRVMTQYSPQAAPKNVRIRMDPGQPGGGSALVQWEAPCPQLSGDQVSAGYRITIRETKLGTVGSVTLSGTNKTSVQHRFRLDRGARYCVQVEPSVSGGRKSQEACLDAPEIPPPHQVGYAQEKNGSVVVWWQAQGLAEQFGKEGVNFTYIVWVSSSSNMSNAAKYESEETMLVIPEPTPGATYYLGVSIRDARGYESRMSEIISSENGLGMDPFSDSKYSLSPGSLVSIVVPIVVVILILSAALTFFVVRHKRLQRSFLSFANSHYDTRSGAATFSGGDGLGPDFIDEEDSPMIRGFSDDEPLVIA